MIIFITGCLFLKKAPLRWKIHYPFQKILKMVNIFCWNILKFALVAYQTITIIIIWLLFRYFVSNRNVQFHDRLIFKLSLCRSTRNVYEIKIKMDLSQKKRRWRKQKTERDNVISNHTTFNVIFTTSNRTISSIYICYVVIPVCCHRQQLNRKLLTSTCKLLENLQHCCFPFCLVSNE